MFRLPGIRGVANGGVDIEAAFKEPPDHPRRDVAVGARDQGRTRDAFDQTRIAITETRITFAGLLPPRRGVPPLGRYYGFPSDRGEGFEIGKYHRRVQPVPGPDRLDRGCAPEDEAAVREGVAAYFSEANGPTCRMVACMFTTSPDEHFVLDGEDLNGPGNRLQLPLPLSRAIVEHIFLRRHDCTSNHIALGGSFRRDRDIA